MFPIEDNLKAKIYPLREHIPSQATFYVPPGLNNFSGKITWCANGGKFDPACLWRTQASLLRCFSQRIYILQNAILLSLTKQISYGPTWKNSAVRL